MKPAEPFDVLSGTYDCAIEERLQGSRPRQVRPRPGRLRGRAWLCAFIVPHTLVGLLMALWVLHLVLVRACGQDVPATIIAHTTSDNDNSTSYLLRFTYTVDGRVYTASNAVGFALYNATSDGTATITRVSPLLPRFNAELLLPGRATWQDIVFPLAFMVFWDGIVGTALFGLGVVPWRHQAAGAHRRRGARHHRRGQVSRRGERRLSRALRLYPPRRLRPAARPRRSELAPISCAVS